MGLPFAGLGSVGVGPPLEEEEEVEELEPIKLLPPLLEELELEDEPGAVMVIVRFVAQSTWELLSSARQFQVNEPWVTFSNHEVLFVVPLSKVL